MNVYKNPECIELVRKQLHVNRDFLSLSDFEIEGYLSKIDSLSIFEKYYIENKLAGFVSFYCNNKESKEAFITMVLVDESYRGKGIAQKLIIEVIDIIKEQGFLKCNLEVKADNVNATKLYSKIGFSESYRKGDIISMSILV